MMKKAKKSKNTHNTRPCDDSGVHFPNVFAYPTGKVSIKSTKNNDLRKCMQYIPNEHTQFYEDILQWPQDDIPDIGEHVDETD